MQRSVRRASLFALTSMALLCCVLILILAMSAPSHAQNSITKPSLGTAGAFAVLGASAVTNTGPSVLNGDLGVSPGSSFTGFPPGVFHGAKHISDAVASVAQNDIKTAYNTIAHQSCPHDMTGQDLGGKTLVAGVYCFSSSAQLTGKLTLSGQGVFLFQIGSTLTTASNASVLLIHGADPCNVFWQVGSSATIGTNTDFAGNILALASITANHGATFNGGLYARSAAVTLDDNTISRSRCSSVPTKTPTPKKTPAPGPAKTPTKTPPIVPTPTPTSEVGLG
jgi:Ice-binding-like